jgi:tRNA(Ile)-lysidine synthase
MPRTFLDTIRASVRHHDLLAPGDRVLAAVSGGADSVALLVGLLELRAGLDITVVLAHLDHKLRGDESTRDRVFVEELAHRYDVPAVIETGEVPAGNVEDEARRLRYAFLERAADQLGATTIATAHTLDDQAETVLLRVLRGAGRRGLGGIHPRRGRIIRPMLACDRMQVRAFLVEHGLSWRRDYSNFDTTLERARVRHGFLPALTREFNPRLVRALANLADVMREEDDLLDRLAAVGARGETLEASVLNAIEAPLARRAVRLWWRRQGSGQRLGRAHVEALRHLAARASDDGEIAVPGGVVRREGHRLRFATGPRVDGTAGPWQVPLVPNQDVETPGGWCLRLTEAAASDTGPPGDRVCLVDASLAAGPFTVRNRQPGDRLHALGLDGHTSIKRLLSARHVPRHRRDDHPLVLCDGEVLWVPGAGRSDRALVGPATTRCWIIRVVRSPNESA